MARLESQLVQMVRVLVFEIWQVLSLVKMIINKKQFNGDGQ
jgi:hypothetical protein